MVKKIICSGSGGQGVLVMGRVLAQAGLLREKNVTWFPSYGAEMRGGAAHCMVIISDNPIASPYVELCDDAILMNMPSIKKFISQVKQNGIVVINKEDLNELALPRELKIINHDFTKEAMQLGNKQVANIIALGAYIQKEDLFKKADLERALEEVLGQKGEDILQLNKTALKRGIELGRI